MPFTFDQLLMATTPGYSAQLQYEASIEDALLKPLPQLYAPDGRGTRVRELVKRRSLLYERDYLLAFVDAEWIAAIAPGCDAIASINEGAPPLVLLPRELQPGIVEHEFVHINQALMGTFPSNDVADSLELAGESFLRRVRSEFEAYFLQGSRWPRPLSLPLEHWALLGGWVDALARTVAGQLCEPAVVPALLSLLPEYLRSRRDLPGELAEWFRAELPGQVRQALSSTRPGNAARAAQAWLDPRY